MNRNILTGIVVTSILTIFFLLVFYFFKINTKTLHAINVLPRNTVFAIEVKNVSLQYKLLNQQLFWQQLCNNPTVSQANNNIKFLDSLLNEQDDFEDWKESENMVISFHAYKNNTVDELIMVETIKKIDIDDAINWIYDNHKERFNKSKRNFLGNTIYDFVDFKTQRAFSIAYKNKLFIVSTNGQLVEEALINANVKKAFETSELDKLSYVKSLGSYNLYVNYKNLPLFVSSYIDLSKMPNLIPMETMAEWAALGVNVNKTNINLKGVSITHDSLFQYFDCFNNLQSSEQSIKKLIPANATYYVGINFNDEKVFEQNLTEYYKVNNINVMNMVRDSIDNLPDYLNLKKNLKLSLGNEIAQIGLHNPQLSIDSCQLLIVKLKNKEILLNEFRQITHTDDSTHHITDTLLANIPNVFQVNLSTYFDYRWGNIFSKQQANYAFLYNDYMVLANNLTTINEFYQQQLKSELLSNNADFINHESELNQNNNIELIINNDFMSQQVEQVLQPEFAAAYASNKGYFKKAKLFSFQMAATTDKNYVTNVHISFNVNESNKTQLMWDLELDTNIVMEPQVVFHSPTNQNVIFVQDAKNQAYLINNESKILFKVPVVGRILGKVNQVDAFNNGKVQYLFNTGSQVYLLDESGKNLQGYPFWIPTGTNYPVLVTDFYKDKTYQVFAIGKFYKIWAYNIQSKLLPGWNPKNAWPNPVQNIQNFTFRNGLVSYVVDEKGKLNFYQLNGKTYNVFGFDSLNNYKFMAHEAIDSTHIQFYYIDSTNLFKVKYFDANGVSKVNIIKTITSKPINSYFINNELHFLNKTNTTYTITNNQGNILYTKMLPDSFNYQMQLMYNSNGYHVSYLDSLAGKVYFESTSNKPVAEFPLKGNLYYKFGNLMNDERNYLITSIDSKLLVYQVK